MSKILVISPKYLPLKDGLAGHTYHLCKQLSGKHEVQLLTDSQIPKPPDNSIELFPVVEKWKFKSVLKSWESLEKIHDYIIIQYVPSLYNKRGGINFSIVLFFLYLRFIKCKKIGFIFHELYYPKLPHWKAWILHYSHRIMFYFTLKSANKAFFSTTHYKHIAEKYTSDKTKLIHLPVGASIEIDSTPHRIINDNSYVLFGGYHPSKNYQLIFDTFEEAHQKGLNFSLTVIGTDLESLIKDITLSKEINQYANFLGKIDDIEVNKIFKKSQYLVSYFSDGVSTRRSSIISALGCGLQVITTKSELTDECFLNSDAVSLLPTNDFDFSDELLKIIKSPKPVSSETVVGFYHEYFDWKKIERLIEINFFE